uniref:Uncharacterized protein n=1 Tax=viral metagenome TaxID=1070528 RepID=A0A6M3INQ8_9ZZZZ
MENVPEGHVWAKDTNLVKTTIEKLTCISDERRSEVIFFFPRGFAKEHHLRSFGKVGIYVGCL